MKKEFVIILLLSTIINIQSFGQQPPSTGFGKPQDSTNFEIKLNPEFFILGTLSDYGGRFYAIDRKKQIDRYYPYEGSLVNYLSKVILDNYKTKVELVNQKNNANAMFSETMANKLHSYYDEKGNLKDNIFDSEEKKYSFLTGVFLRYGAFLQDNFYKIHLYNSPKDKEILALLKDLNCDKIVYKSLNGIPNSDIFYFEATPRLIKYFNTVKSENNARHDAYLAQAFGKPLDNEKKKELKEHLIAEQNKLVESLKYTFK